MKLGRLQDHEVRVALVKPASLLGVELAADVTEQRDPAAMASLGAPPYATAEVARAWRAESQRQSSPHGDGLIQKGLMWSPRRDQADFTVPLFAELLLAHHRLGGFDDE